MGEERLKRGQAVVIDMIVATGIFILITVILIISLNYYNQKLARDIEYNDMAQKSMFIADTLVFSPGIPYNWTTSNYVLPGLARDDRNLSYAKLLNFTNLTADQIKDAFKIKSYNYTFAVRYQHNNSYVTRVGEFTDNYSLIASSRRTVTYGNETVYIDFSVWK